MIYDYHVRLRDLRLQASLQQDYVAMRVGVAKSTMCAYEAGTRRPSYETLVQLADLYHTTTDYILGRTMACSVDVSGLTEAEREALLRLIAVFEDGRRR